MTALCRVRYVEGGMRDAKWIQPHKNLLHIQWDDGTIEDIYTSHVWDIKPVILNISEEGDK